LSLSVSVSSEFDKLSFFSFVHGACSVSHVLVGGVGECLLLTFKFYCFLCLYLFRCFYSCEESKTLLILEHHPHFTDCASWSINCPPHSVGPNDSGRPSVRPLNVTQHFAPNRIELATQIPVAKCWHLGRIIYCRYGSSSWLSCLLQVKARFYVQYNSIYPDAGYPDRFWPWGKFVKNSTNLTCLEITGYRIRYSTVLWFLELQIRRGGKVYTQVHTVNSNSRISNCQCSLLSKKYPIIRIFCLSGCLVVPVNPDKWSSTLLWKGPW